MDWYNWAYGAVSNFSAAVAQRLVDQCELKFNEAIISNISNEGFDLSLQGSLTGTGPVEAKIEFTEPVKVEWEGSNIATIELPSILAAAGEGVPNYCPNAHLIITDRGKFTQFSIFLWHNPSFSWTIFTDKLRVAVTSLGSVFENVILRKNVTFRAFDALSDVGIRRFELPCDVDVDAEGGGIQIEIDSEIPCHAQLGINLGSATFTTKFKGVTVGRLKTTQNLILSPNSVTNTHLTGRIVPQSGSDLEVIGELFSKYLAGENQTLQVIGESVHPSESESASSSPSPVGWLTAAIQSLTLEVILPGQKFEVRGLSIYLLLLSF
ncbi:hypothetical protein D9758_006521 [Tetrapyrgos nigripes]|uniref:Uncharacterized protein n=1 Tax=Tetrapyrgos nigripes TaxID=182062 RepID=A0A8H5LRJ0_9AGAR|nr:hypothetical protein D9758_006521 [Tetrapyrgos nigripes]